MCTETEYCDQAKTSLLTQIDLYEGSKGRCDFEITPNKQNIYKEMIKRGDAIIDPVTKHAKLNGLRWTLSQTQAEYVGKFGLR